MTRKRRVWAPLWRFYSPRIYRALDRGNTRRALRLARHYAYFYPQDPNAWYALSHVLFETGDLPEAEKALREGTSRHRWDWLHLRLAQLLLSRSELGEVREMAEKVSRRQPKSPVPSILLADLARHDNDRDAYLRYSREAADRLESTSHPWDLMSGIEVVRRLEWLPEEEKRGLVILRQLVEDRPQPRLYAMLGFLLEASDPDSSARYLAEARRVGASAKDLDEMSEAVRDASHERWTEDDETVDA